MDHSFIIHERNLQNLAIEMYKVKNNLSPSFMKTIFPLSTNPYHLRTRQIYNIKYSYSHIWLRNYITQGSKNMDTSPRRNQKFNKSARIENQNKAMDATRMFMQAM